MILGILKVRDIRSRKRHRQLKAIRDFERDGRFG